MSLPDFNPNSVVDGELPPWQIALAYAFHVALIDIAEHLSTPVPKLVGQAKAEYIASKVTLKGGGHPVKRTIHQVVERCSQEGWYPGKPTEARRNQGRQYYSEHVKNEVARVGMDLKRKLIRPTPRKVRARLHNLARNAETGAPISDTTVQTIFQTRCYDKSVDDPWQYLPCLSQDCLPGSLLPKRVACGKHVLKIVHPTSWTSQVSIDPCYSLLAKTAERQEEQAIQAMGKEKWMSPGCRREGSNPRAPATTKTQSGGDVARVDWTPIFAKGRLTIYVVDPLTTDRNMPPKLLDSANISKFIRNVLPDVLKSMQRKYGWNDLPRTLVHDKASYFVDNKNQRLQFTFHNALKATGMRSWIGDVNTPTDWLVKKFGDFYLHETINAHIRRLESTDFVCRHLCETPAQFKARMQKIEDFMNSPDFRAEGGNGLLGLAKEMRSRAEGIMRSGGERLPT